MVQSSDEKRGYSRGYAAGKKRIGKQIKQEKEYLSARSKDWKREIDGNYNAAFLACLPSCISGGNWVDGDNNPIVTVADRVELANELARAAARYMRVSE